MNEEEIQMAKQGEKAWWAKLPAHVGGDMIVADVGAGAQGVAGRGPARPDPLLALRCARPCQANPTLITTGELANGIFPAYYPS